MLFYIFSFVLTYIVNIAKIQTPPKRSLMNAIIKIMLNAGNNKWENSNDDANIVDASDNLRFTDYNVIEEDDTVMNNI